MKQENDGQAEEVMLRGPRWELHVHHGRRARHPCQGQDRKGGPRAKQHHKLDLGTYRTSWSLMSGEGRTEGKG